MPEDLPDDELDESPDDSNVVRQLRRQAKEANARAKQLEEQAQRGMVAERKLKFLEAGVPMTNPLAEYFVKGYDGDIEIEAIQKAAQAAGLLAAVPDPNAPDLAAVDRITNASQGAVVMPPPGDKPDLNAIVNQATAGVYDPMQREKIAIQAMRDAGIQFDDR